MNIKKLQKHWNEFGKTDPLWAILTAPDKKGSKWQIDEFFKTGVDEIEAVFKYLKSLNISIAKRKALDFGCGVGRLTQALAYYFDEVYGVDIAPSMIDLARKYNRHGNKCKYFLNEDNLKLFDDNSFDFIYSNIVLQHIKPKYSKKYIMEFLRILMPYGVVIFQQPSREKPTPQDTTIGKKLKKIVKNILPSIWIDLYRNKVQMKRNEEPKMEMYEIRRKDVVALLEENGATIIDISEDPNWSTNWISLRYCVTKKA